MPALHLENVLWLSAQGLRSTPHTPHYAETVSSLHLPFLSSQLRDDVYAAQGTHFAFPFPTLYKTQLG